MPRIETLVIGSRNTAKIDHIRYMFKNLPIEIKSIVDFGIVDEISEGEDIVINARNKAIGYSRLVNLPVISIDNGLWLAEFPNELQPGPKVRRIPGFDDKRPSDHELLEYYCSLIKKYGKNGQMNGEWRYAVCLAFDSDNYEEILVTSSRIFVSQPSNLVKEGYPMDSIQMTNNGRYLSEISSEEREITVANEVPAIRNFLKSIITLR